MAVPVRISVLDRHGAPLPQAAVSVEVRGLKTRAAIGTQAAMAQRNRNFDPGVLVVQVGTAVQFPNFDTVRHHVYSFSPTRTFEIKLYAGTPSAPVVFDQAGTAVLGCNIHDRMTAFVHVVSTPHFALSGADGSVVLDLPEGEHTVQAWHPLLGDTQPPQRSALKIGAGLPSSATLRLGVSPQAPGTR